MKFNYILIIYHIINYSGKNIVTYKQKHSVIFRSLDKDCFAAYFMFGRVYCFSVFLADFFIFIGRSVIMEWIFFLHSVSHLGCLKN